MISHFFQHLSVPSVPSVISVVCSHAVVCGGVVVSKTVSGVVFPEGFQHVPLQKGHPRRAFDCGQNQVNDSLRIEALQHQDKRLSATSECYA